MSNNTVEKKCRECGATFTDTAGGNKCFCSPKCRNHFVKQPHVSHTVIVSLKVNHDRITRLNDEARQLGLSYGMYKAYLSMGLNPADFARVRSVAPYELP